MIALGHICGGLQGFYGSKWCFWDEWWMEKMHGGRSINLYSKIKRLKLYKWCMDQNGGMAYIVSKGIKNQSCNSGVHWQRWGRIVQILTKKGPCKCPCQLGRRQCKTPISFCNIMYIIPSIKMGGLTSLFIQKKYKEIERIGEPKYFISFTYV